MKYTLIGSERSPFVRICRLLMINHQIDFEFRVLNFVDDAKAADALEKETPINKVPILLEGDRKIFDSRVIVNYLGKKHGLPELTIDEENLVSAIYGCMDASVILFMMKKDGIDVNGSGNFLRRNRARIPSSLEYIMPWVRTLDAKKPSQWNYPSMSLFAYLFWAEKRGFLEVKEYPVLAEFMRKFADAPGVSETGF